MYYAYLHTNFKLFIYTNEYFTRLKPHYKYFSTQSVVTKITGALHRAAINISRDKNRTSPCEASGGPALRSSGEVF